MKRGIHALLRLVLCSSLLISTSASWRAAPLYAQQTDSTTEDPAIKQEVDTLEAQVKERQQKVKEIDSLISGYRKEIAKHENEAVSLQNQVALLDQRIAEKQLAIERTRKEMEATNLEIQLMGAQIRGQQDRLSHRQDVLREIFVHLQQDGETSPIEAFFARPSLSEFFAHVDELSRVEGELGDATRALQTEKQALEAKKAAQEERRQALAQQQTQLEQEEQQLRDEGEAKESLLLVTSAKEDEFKRVIYELRQQQQSEAANVEALQQRLKERLDSIDQALARGDVLLNWPVIPPRGISAEFHDKSYPFRNLFEHPGIDIPTPVGTPVKAAAGGYIAWTRLGSQYGNYIMVVHAGGVATVYAHLSKFAVKPDTYVERGDIIGYSGGKAGDPGAGLSTGPHLHFEVRQNGIPVNPRQFLPQL